jgi:hypothetical protein
LQEAAMKLAIGLVLATCAPALVLVSERALQPRDAPLKSDIGWRNPNPESTIGTRVDRMTALRFTVDQFTWSFWSEGTWNLVWYSGFGGELLAWVDESRDKFGDPFGYVYIGWELWPDNRGRFPEESLIKSLRSLRGRVLRRDVERILLGMPLDTPESEVAARIVRKEFESINHSFDWAAYAARQNRRESVLTVRPATILAAEEHPSGRARRAAREAIDFLSWD